MSGLFSAATGDASMRGEFIGFVADEAALLALRRWAARQGYPAATAQQGGPDLFAQMLESGAPPKLAVIDVDGHSDPVAVAARLVGLVGRDCRLVIIGSTNDVTLYRQIIGTGVADYLVKPLSDEPLNQALVAAQRGQGANKPAAREARIIAVIGSRGGVGASTLAINVGWIMAHELGLGTVLLDLDLQFGSSALGLDLEAGRGLRDIVGSPHRVDSLMISSSLVAESDAFSLLAAEEAIDEGVVIDSGAITALLKEMKNNFAAIVIDMPRFLLATQKRVLTTAHNIIIVSELTLAGIRDTLRIKSAIASLGCAATITVVASRTGASGAGQIDRAVFEKGIQGKIDATLAEDAAAMTVAANSGKALGETAPRAAVTQALRDLSIKLAGVASGKAEKPSWLDKMLGKKKAARSAP